MEQIVDMHVPHVAKEILQELRDMPQQRLAERSAVILPQERMSERRCEQTVSFPLWAR